MEKEISYIAKRYRKGRFSADKGWKRLHIAPALKWKRLRVAASIASVIALLSPAAAIVYHRYHQSSETAVKQSIQPKEAVKVIDFENTALPVVISKIKEVYGAEVINLPDNANAHKLSLHYEGNAADLVATINEILDTQMTLKE